MAAEQFDVAVVGGGPNGLTAAAYLQRAGAKVVVLDKRFEWGGTLATDDYSTPFFYNLCQYALPLGAELPPYQDLELHRDGLRIVEPDPVAAFMPAGGGDPLVLSRDDQGLSKNLREQLDAVNTSLPALFYLPPSPEDELRKALARNGTTEPAAKLAAETPASLAQDAGDSREAALIRYLCAQLGFVDDKTPLGLLGAIAFARQLRPAVPFGGAKALADALFRAGARAGVQYRAVAAVTRIERRGEGFVLGCHDGREFEARAAISTLDPATTFLELLDADLVPGTKRKGLQHAAEEWRHDTVAPFTAHFGLKGQPPHLHDQHASEAFMQVVGFEDADAVMEHLRTVEKGGLPSKPAGHLTVTTHHDLTQAAPGPFGPLHTLRFQTPSPYRHPDGEWDHKRADYRTWCWEALSRYVEDDGQARLLFAFADAPEDITRRFRTTRAGTPRQGALIQAQTFTERPHPDASTCRTPVDFFYLGGGGVHPGIPGSLGGGYNAARVVCDDLGLERWWSEPALVRRARDAGLLPRDTLTVA